MRKTIVQVKTGILTACFSIGLISVAAAAPTGGFLAVMNENGNNSDSRLAITFFDVDEFDQGPLFSVFIGYERPGNRRELSAIEADPVTGDIYVVGFDSGTPGAVDNLGTPAELTDDDSSGDYDLYKIDFASLYGNWETNYKGKDVRALGLVDPLSPAPSGSKGAANIDYVTYAPTTVSSTITFTHEATHSNAVTLASSIVKIGEINRNQNPDAAPFWQADLEFVDSQTLFMLDDSNEATASDNAANDHAYRMIKRVSTSPGLATSNNDVGGYNNTTTQSWESSRAGLVNLDTVAGVPTGHSEPQDSAFYTDPVTGVRGAWVMERDGGGDDVALFQVTPAGAGVGYRPFSTGETAFALDNDPFVDATTNDGFGDKIFVDQDSGDLIMIESSFGDPTPGEVGVIRREVLSYDNGSGQIEFGAWSPKVILNPVKDPASEAGVFFERGYFSSYDSVNDKVYFYEPGNSPDFEMEVYVLDLATGLTTSFLNVDDSVSLFTTATSATHGDKGAFFSIGAVATDDADFDNDNDVDGNDFLIWQRGFSVGNNNATGDADGNGVVDGADLAVWKSQFGAAAAAAVGSVPEPATLAMGTLGCLALAAARRRR